MSLLNHRRPWTVAGALQNIHVNPWYWLCSSSLNWTHLSLLLRHTKLEMHPQSRQNTKERKDMRWSGGSGTELVAQTGVRHLVMLLHQMVSQLRCLWERWLTFPAFVRLVLAYSRWLLWTSLLEISRCTFRRNLLWVIMCFFKLYLCRNRQPHTWLLVGLATLRQAKARSN